MKNHGTQPIMYFLAVGVVFSILLGITAIPVVLTASAGNSSTFNVSLTLSNSAPNITAVAPISDSPSEATTKVVTFYFNASDSNGISDIPADNAAVNINLSGTEYSSSACVATQISTTENAYECNITIDYYYTAGTYDINASVFDGGSAQAEDTTSADFTLGTTYSLSLAKTALTFSGDPGENDVNASNAPQIANNTGNGAFSTLGLTAYNLVDGSNTIGAGNFTGGTSGDPGAGQTLADSAEVNLTSSTLGVQNTQNVWVFLDIPEGTPDGTYDAESLWIVTAY